MLKMILSNIRFLIALQEFRSKITPHTSLRLRAAHDNLSSIQLCTLRLALERLKSMWLMATWLHNTVLQSISPMRRHTFELLFFLCKMWVYSWIKPSLNRFLQLKSMILKMITISSYTQQKKDKYPFLFSYRTTTYRARLYSSTLLRIMHRLRNIS